MIDFSTLQGLTIPEGVVTQIEDEAGNVIWLSGGGKIILEVEKITSNTYAGETLYENEQFILLNIYPKTNGTVSVTYGGLTKTITDTSGAAEPNAQQVFFGTFNGVSDDVETPTSGELTIEGDCKAVSTSIFVTSSKTTSARAYVVTAIHSLVGVSEIPSSAFNGCEKISSVRIPGSVRNIYAAAFSGCTNLKDVILSNGVKMIAMSVFLNCPLSSITIPASVTEMALGNPFAGCNPNNFITVDEGNLHYKIDNNCLVEIATACLVAGFVDSIIPSYIKRIGYTAFGYCTELTNIDIPNGVTSIGNSAFYSCESLTSITIPDSVTSIGNSAFGYCRSLTSITIPESVIDMGDMTFTGCTALREVIVLATTPPTVIPPNPDANPTWFYGCTLSSITVPKGCGEAYKAASGWSRYADYIVEAS